MAFKKGQGGRPKGAVNKATKEFRKTLEEHGFDFHAALIEAFDNAKADYLFVRDQLTSGRFSPMEDNCYKYMANVISILKEIGSYSYPKLKSVEQVKDMNQDRPLKNWSDEELDKA